MRLERLELSEATTTALRKRKDPMSQPELKSALSLCSVIRRFVSSLSKVTAPFKKMLPEDQPTSFPILTQTERAAVDSLTTVWTNPPKLALLRATGKVTVGTYACYSQVESFLS